MTRAAAGVFLLLFSRALFACQCGERPTAEDVFPRASAVFTGVVMGRHPVVVRSSEIKYPAGVEVPPLYAISRVDIAVTRVFKGHVQSTFQLSEIGCCVCEYNFEVGQRYLIFAHPHPDLPNRWMASFCWPTKPEAEAAQEISWFGQPLRTFDASTFRRPFFHRIRDSGHSGAARIVRRWLHLPDKPQERLYVLVWLALTVVLSCVLLAVFIRAWRRKSRAV